MNILGLLGLPPVKPYTNSKAIPLSCSDPSLLYGLELEIEGIAVDPSEWYVGGMGGEADNSLRDNEYGRGWEFITKPATFSVAAFVLNNFFNKAKLTQERNYSERCSVHVHVNVQDLTPEQLKTVCFLYQVFERVFYAYAGEDRDKNIFCVPWSETTITHGIVDRLTPEGLKMLTRWQKYTGLNLIPVTSQGTVEFRHLPGTCDLPRILGWMNMIGSLFFIARNYSFKDVQAQVISVNTTSEYRHLVKYVFREWEGLVDVPNLEELLEDGVLNVKYMILSSTGKSKANQTWAGLVERELDARVQAELRAERPGRPAGRNAPQPAGQWIFQDDLARREFEAVQQVPNPFFIHPRR